MKMDLCKVVFFRNALRINFVSILLLIGYYYSFAQQLDNIKSQQPITLGGFVSTNQVVNSQPADSGGIITYTGFYTGSLNFNIYGISIPLTFIYSNNQGDFSHPFNQYGIHPSYKWVHGHIGYASMTFSPYTLNGHLFLGAGFDIDPPGIIRASVMCGQLKKSVEYDTNNIQQLPSYKRLGYGVKIGLAGESDYIDFVIFGASDKIGSIDTIPTTLEILPQENTAFSISAGKKIGKRLSITAEYANSFLTYDSRSEYGGDTRTFLQPATWLMPSRLTSTSKEAIKANFTYQVALWSMGVRYEKVDPDYATLGAYYFTNNMENMTLNFSVNFFESKLSFNGNGGLQRDNLDNSKMNNNRRYVGSGNVNLVPSEKLNFNLSYSNFLSYTNVRSTFDYINETSPYENWDTLNYRQISQNTNLNTSYQILSNEQNRQSFTANLTYQVSDNEQSGNSVDKSRFYNVNTAYIMAFVPLNLNISLSCNYNQNEVPDAGTKTFGPSITISKMFFEKTLRSSLTGSYNNSKTNGISTGDVINFRMGGAYILKQKHNLNLNFLYQMRKSKSRDLYTYSLSFGYVYNFNVIGKKET